MDPKDPLYHDAKVVFNYHRVNTPTKPADAIFCLCSLDTRVASYAAQLYLDGLGKHLIFSGGSGILTRDRFTQPEAVIFAEIAVSMGVPKEKIIVEPLSTNTGENVRFTHALLEQRGLLPLETLLLVQKPYMERRTFATFVKQWPDEGVEFAVTSPPLGFDEYPNEENPRELVTSIMVGDLVRIREYPKRGFQIEQEIPNEVWEAGQRLIQAGYNKHLP